MIATITGIVLQVSEQTIIIEQAGIGFELYVANPLHFTRQEKTTVVTHMHWNSDNGPTLYGFAHAIEKTTFLLIISCSGIGPKIGLAILHHLEPALFLQAVVQENIDTLSAIPGIGAKKAEQICVALKHKVAKLLKENPDVSSTSAALTIFKDLNDTLNSLGYNNTEIKSVHGFLKDNNINESVHFSTILRKSLAFLSTRS